jgi:hypothetical protein
MAIKLRVLVEVWLLNSGFWIVTLYLTVLFNSQVNPKQGSHLSFGYS